MIVLFFSLNCWDNPEELQEQNSRTSEGHCASLRSRSWRKKGKRRNGEQVERYFSCPTRALSKLCHHWTPQKTLCGTPDSTTAQELCFHDPPHCFLLRQTSIIYSPSKQSMYGFPAAPRTSGKCCLHSFHIHRSIRMVKEPKVADDIMVSLTGRGSCCSPSPLNAESWRRLAKVTIIDQQG